MPEIYTIQPGDNLTHLAQRNGVTISQILAVNPQIKHRDLIYAGHKLRIPSVTKRPGTTGGKRPTTDGSTRATSAKTNGAKVATAKVAVSTQLSVEDKELIAKVARMRSWASSLGFTNAVAALDHYLGKSGEFVEIPESKVTSVRKEAETDHQRKLIAAIQHNLGARTMLALTGLVDATGKAKRVETWPRTVEFEMDYGSGVARGGVSDDNLTYYGSVIQSRVVIRGQRIEKTRCYTLQIKSWKSWVADNYDWEGDKQFGGRYFTWLLPSQKQMHHLSEIGRAKPYQRSSKSWMSTSTSSTWNECFDTDHDAEADAKIRKLKQQHRSANQERERKSGALDMPGPAEEMQ